MARRRTTKKAATATAPMFGAPAAPRICGKPTAEFNSVQDLSHLLRSSSRPGMVGVNSDDYSFVRYTWDETLDALSRGWPEGSADVSFSASLLSDAMTEDSTGIEYDVTGDYIDIGVYLSGVPECMGTFTAIQKPKAEISLIINTSVYYDAPQDAIITRGAVITALVERLSRDYYVSIKFVNNGDNIDFVFNLDMREGFSRDAIAFFTSHPGFLRRIIFTVREIYGFSHSNNVKEWPSDKMKPTDIYFPAVNSYNVNWFQDIESSKRYIEQVISKLTQNKANID